MNEEFNPMVTPHPPLPLPHERNQDQTEVDPIRVDAIIDALVGLNPVAVDITRIWLLRTEATVDIDLFDTGGPKSFDGGAEPLQQPPTTGREAEALPDLLQRGLMISRWQRASARVKLRNQRATSIISGTIINVNINAVNVTRQPAIHRDARFPRPSSTAPHTAWETSAGAVNSEPHL